jgi:tellurite resistance protein
MSYRRHRARTAQLVRTELQDIVLEREHNLIFMALVTAAALVARADRTVDRSERDGLVDWVEKMPLLQGFGPDDVIEAFDRRVAEFEQPDGIATGLRTLRHAAGIRAARLVIGGAEQVARADGHVQQSEIDVLKLVRGTLVSNAAVADQKFRPMRERVF